MDGSTLWRRQRHRSRLLHYSITYWFVEEDSRKEIVKHFSDLWVSLNVLFVAVNQLVLQIYD